MRLDTHDTIVALASAPGGAPRGIVRLSGPAAMKIVGLCFEPAASQPGLESLRTPHRIEGALRIAIVDGEAEQNIPCWLLVWPGTRSYTRQPVVEIHTFGSPPILEATIEQLVSEGARLAERGEFTLRAFLAGRIDLTQAEAVLGVIDARGEQELATALRQLAGGLSTVLDEVRTKLLVLLAEVEAGLDFADEDIEFISPERLHEMLSEARLAINAVQNQMDNRSESSARPRVVIVGKPNAGKSSLFNHLVERLHPTNKSRSKSDLTIALVSPVAGTTRDFVSTIVQVAGQELELIDTAGVAKTSVGEIDSVAQDTARRLANEAAVLIECIDASLEPTPTEDSDSGVVHTGDSSGPIVRAETDRQPKLRALTKSDKLDSARYGELDQAQSGALVSSLTGAGIPTLVQRLEETLDQPATQAASGCVASTALRCRDSLRESTDAIARAIGLVERDDANELVATEVRCALASLGAVVGTVYTDDILDRIFNQFCIGK